MADDVLVKNTGGTDYTVDTTQLSTGEHVQSVQLVTAVAAGTKADLAKAEDAAHTSGDKGLMALAVRKDTAAALAGTDGDYIPLIVDATGQLYVKADVPAADVSGDSVAAALGARATPGADMTGLTALRTISGASTNATSVKASAGQLYWLHVVNMNAAVRYLKFYNKASSPTVGTDTPVYTFPIPASTTGAGFVLSFPVPITFATGIALAITTGVADSDTGAVAANEIIVNGGYA
jgi:hypothetical protein